MHTYLMPLLFILHGVLHGADIIHKKQLQWNTRDVLWLITGILFIITAILFFFTSYWWSIAAITLVLSQTLIVLSWKTARYGSIINTIIIPCILSGWGSWYFKKINQQEKILLITNSYKSDYLKNKSLQATPPLIHKWMIRSGISETTDIINVRLTQRGNLKTKADGSWMPMTAEQYFSIPEPAFIWTTNVEINKWVNLSGRDLYKNGTGEMFIEAFAFFPLVNERGKEIDQGTLQRYMAEMIWFPSAALSPYIKWQQLSDCKAQATIAYKGVTATGIFHFSADGDFKSFETMRYYKEETGYNLKKWVIEATEDNYRTFESIRVPTKLSVTWKLDSGDFTWLKLEVLDITYNIPLTFTSNTVH